MAFDYTNTGKGIFNKFLNDKKFKVKGIPIPANGSFDINEGAVATGPGVTNSPILGTPDTQGIPRITGGTPIPSQSPQTDPTQGYPYKALAPLESTPQVLQGFSNAVSPVLEEGKRMVENQAPGLKVAQENNMYVPQAKMESLITDLYKSMPDASDEELAEAMKQMGDEGYIFEGFNDKNIDSPMMDKWGIKEGREVLGGALGAASVVSKIPGGVGTMMEGTQNISEGNTNLGASQVFKGATDVGMGALTGAFPATSSLFMSQPVAESPIGAGFEFLGEKSQQAVGAGLNLTGMDQNSPEYQNYLESGTAITTLLTTLGLFKGGKKVLNKTFGENVNYNSTVGDFVKGSKSTMDDFGKAASQAFPNRIGTITEKTPLSQIFTPDEFSYIKDIATSKGVPLRKEGIISDAFQDKTLKTIGVGIDKTLEAGVNISRKGVEMGQNLFTKTPKEKAQPINPKEGNAVNSEGHVYTQESPPSTASKIYKGIFTKGDNEALASRAVTPSVSGKTTNQKINAGAIALTGLQRLHNDATSGKVSTDVSTMDGGVEGIQQGLEYYGGKIGELTGVDGSFNVGSELKNLQTAMNQRGASITPDLNTITTNILKDFAQFGPEITISEAQQLLSTIKSNIFSDPARIKQLSSTISGSGLDEFIKAFEAKFQEAIDSLQGNTRELADAKKAYSEYKAIQKDLINSYVVELRNQAKSGGLSNAMGNVGALMELVRKPSISSLASSLLIKAISQQIGKGKTRNAAYEKLMQNLKSEDMQRAKGKMPIPKKKEYGNIFEQNMAKQGRKKLPPAPEAEVMKEKTSSPDITEKSIVRRPTTQTPEERVAVAQQKRTTFLNNIKNDIASDTKSARYGGTGNTRVEAIIDAKLAKGEITKEEALAILEDVKTNKRYQYIDQKALDAYIEKIKSGKVESFEEMIAPKEQPKGVEKKQTHKQIYDKLQKIANDGRYEEKSWNDLASEFKKQTGQDIEDTSFEDFGDDGMITKGVPKLTKEGLQAKVNIAKGKIVSKKKEETTAIVKKDVKLETDITNGKIDINSVLKEFNEKSKYFRDSGVTVKAIKVDGNIDDIVRSGKKLKEGWSYVEQKKLGKTEKTQGWYIQEPLNPIGGGTTITAIRADGVGVRASLPDGYKSIEGTVVRDFVDNVIDRNPFIDTEIKSIVEKSIVPKKEEGIKPKTETKGISPKTDTQQQMTLGDVSPETKPIVNKAKVASKPESEMTLAEKVQFALDAKQANKEFKDVEERVAGSRKEKALYRKLTMEDYKKVEAESPALANDLVTRDRVIQDKYDPKAGKEAGDGAGLAYIKDKILSSLTKKPETGKEFRETFVKDVPELYQKIAEAKSLEEIKTIAEEVFRLRYTRSGDSVVFIDSSKPDAIGVYGKKFLDTLMNRTDGAKQTWLDAEKKQGLTSEGLIKRREAYIEKLNTQLENKKTKFASEDWEAIAKRVMPGYKDHFESVLRDKFSPTEYRNQSPAIVKKIAAYYKDMGQKSIDTFIESKLKSFDSDPNNQVREHDWGYLADQTETKGPFSKGEKSDTPTLHGGETIKEIYREGGREVSAEEVSSPEKIKELFGYKSTQFGNYMRDADSIEAVKNFIGAMRDLEDITGIDIKKLNEKEGLSIAFGARGHGRASAHYEPTYNIINLTKGNGNGSVAHEFGHFLDWSAGKILNLMEFGFPKALSKEEPAIRRLYYGMVAEPTAEVHPVLKAMQNLVSTIRGLDKKHTKNVKIQPEEGIPTYSRIKTMFEEKGLEATIKTINETNYKESDKLKYLKYIANLNGGEITVPMTKKGTRYYSDSSSLGKYWGSTVELIARAFEAYIQDLGVEKGIKSNYLVADNNHSFGSRKHGELHIYPLGEERVLINKAFDEFLKVFKEHSDIVKTPELNKGIPKKTGIPNLTKNEQQVSKPISGDTINILKENDLIKSSPKPIVKNLQKTEKSATIGDMETKKLIEEARKAKDFTGTPLYEKKLSKDLVSKAIENNKGKKVTVFLKGTQYGNPKTFEGELKGMELNLGLDNHRVIIKQNEGLMGNSLHFYENIKDIQIDGKSIFDENKLHSEFADEILKRKSLAPKKSTKGIVAPKKIEITPIVKKEGTESKLLEYKSAEEYLNTKGEYSIGKGSEKDIFDKNGKKIGRLILTEDKNSLQIRDINRDTIYSDNSGKGIPTKIINDLKEYSILKNKELSINTRLPGTEKYWENLGFVYKKVGGESKIIYEKSNPKTLVKPNPPKNEQQVSKPNASDTIPEGYTKNMFGEIIKKPSNSKGGFIRIPGKPKPIVKRASDANAGLIEEARKYKSAEEFVRAQGEPVYHGTLADFESFDMGKAGTNTNWENAKFGTFFLDDAQKAKEFPDLVREPGDNRPVKVKKAFIELKNPIDLTIEGIFTKEKQAPIVLELLGGEKMPPKEALQFLKDEIGLGEIGDLKEALYGDIKNKALMQKAGYDGIISDYGDGIIEKVVFDTKQIKTESQLKQIYEQAHNGIKRKLGISRKE